MEENNQNSGFTENSFTSDSSYSENVAELTKEELEQMLVSQKKKGRAQGISYSLLVLAIMAVIGYAVFLISGVSIGSRNTGLINDAVIEKTNSLWNMINKYYLWDEDVIEENAVDSMYKAMFNSLGDPYSVYYTKEEFDELAEGYSGEYSGIGAYISQKQDTLELFISRPMPGSPAEEAGLAPNDYIYTVDGEDILGQDINVVVAKIKGPEHTTVDIGVKHENQGEIEVITVERRTIEVAMVESDMLEDNIGYIWIYEFEGKTKSQFDSAYSELKSKGMEGLIVDLRDNPGGDLEVVTDLCDEFLDGGMIVSTKDKYGKGYEFKADSKCEKIPMVIITNENSASASEIFSGCLKERGVAKLVGKNTYGKGIVQTLLGLQDGSGIKITESEYFLPDGDCIHGVGIKPDYEVDLDVKAYLKDKTKDAQKDKAIEVMKELLK